MSRAATNRSITRVMGYVAAAAFLASWFLPVLDGIPGWLAFRYALVPPSLTASSVEVQTGRPLEDAVPAILSAVTNLVFIVVWALWRANRPPRPGLFLRLAIACLIVDLYWLVTAWRGHEIGALRVGYYVWLTAFALMAAVAGISAASARRTSRTPTDDTPS